MIATRRPTADDLVRARIPREIKDRAFSALDELGIKPSEFIRMAFSQVAKTGKLPSELEKNRRLTKKAVADAKAERVKKFATVTDLMADLKGDDE